MVEGSVSSRDLTVDKIVLAEWEFFQRVNNEGGRASCQDAPATFSVMRRSQFFIWTDAMLESYLADLVHAHREGRNPLAEKYAYMMKSTHPAEYAQIAAELPPISPEKADVVEKIVAIQLEWARDMAVRFPHLMGRGRPLYSTADSHQATSLETYARGELSTYSLATLKLMLAHFAKAAASGANLQELSDEEQVRGLGYASLAEADAAAAARNEGE